MSTSSLSRGLRGLLAASIFGVVAASLSAVTAADPSSASVAVSYADLNIASASGARALYGRIRAAAKSACSYFVFETDADEARCVHNAIANAVTKLNQPTLSAVYNAELKTSPVCALVSQNR